LPLSSEKIVVKTSYVPIVAFLGLALFATPYAIADADGSVALKFFNAIIDKVTPKKIFEDCHCTDKGAMELADSELVCNDLAKFSCSGTLYDGTGTVDTDLTKYKRTVELFAWSRVDWLSRKFTELVKTSKSDQSPLLKVLDPNCVGEADSCLETAAKNFPVVYLSQLLPEMMAKGLRADLPPNKVLDYIQSSPIYREINDQFLEDAAKSLQTDQRIFIEKVIFKKTKESLVTSLKTIMPAGGLLERMIRRIGSIPLNKKLCNHEESLTGSFYSLNAGFYSPTSDIELCGGFVASVTSEFALVTSLAHELTHSIDPCDFGKGFSSDITESPGLSASFYFQYSGRVQKDVEQAIREYPLGRALQCLQNNQSVEARPVKILRKSDDPEYENKRQEALKKDGRPYICFTQFNEAFADLMAADTLARYMTKNHPELSARQVATGVVNSFKIFDCSKSNHFPNFTDDSNRKSEEYVDDEHPSDRRRYNRIILANKLLRIRLGCQFEFPAPDCLEKLRRSLSSK